MISTAVESATKGQCILESAWYCGQTTVGRERSLNDALARIGVETFLPQVRDHFKRHKENSDEISHYTKRGAFFPGYLFAKLGEYEWSRVKLQLGVSVRVQWVNFGSGPIQVPGEWIEMLKAGRIEETEQVEERKYPQIISGQMVEIVDGPLSGFHGVFDRELSGGERVVILINMLGARRSVEF